MTPEPITRSTNGAKFYKADLHLHTPGSNDFDTAGNEVSAEDYVDTLEAVGLDLVAVTDHDSSGWYEEVRAASEGRDVEVLPGVEITTPGGGEHEVHMTAIFPPNNANAVDSLLGSQGLLTTAEGEAVSNDNIWRICDEVRNHDGLPILAHIDVTCGALNENPRDTRTRRRIFDEERVAALEAVQPESIEENLGDFAYIRSSDAHSLDSIGMRVTHIKMGEPSFEGLRIALKDPESRIMFETPEYDHPAITGVRLDGEFFEQKELKLNQNLNCLIGGKGTGKSCVIEHIRYALDIEPRSSRIREEYREKIEETLGGDGEVEVHLKTTESDEYIVSRQFGESPQIFGPDDREVPLTISEFKDEFFGVEMYSQRELLEIALDARSQLELLDSYFDLEDAKEQCVSVESKIQENGNRIRQLESECEEYREALTNVDVLRENINRLEDRGVGEYVEGEENWDNEKSVLRRLSNHIEDFKESIDELEVESTLNAPDRPDSQPNEELLDDAYDELSKERSAASGYVKELRTSLDDTFENIQKIREKWEVRYEQRQSELSELADEIKEEIGVDIEDYFDLKARERELQEIEENLEEAEEEIEALQTERGNLFEELTEARSRVSELRREGINNLNSELDQVRVRLNENQDRSKYINWVEDVLTGSNLQNDYRELVATEFDPRQLAQIIRDREYGKVVDIGLTETGAHNLIDHDRLRDKIHELELQEILDEPVIQILDGRGGWKPLDSMSDGQRCTSLLSIAMLERDTPLIIDQPEDMLDNEFIYTTVVRLIREIKHDRQIIAVTHNANIPVLGDAELIVELRSSGSNGHFSTRGSIDDPSTTTRVQTILEGGEQAFDKRIEKYGY